MKVELQDYLESPKLCLNGVFICLCIFVNCMFLWSSTAKWPVRKFVWIRRYSIGHDVTWEAGEGHFPRLLPVSILDLEMWNSQVRRQERLEAGSKNECAPKSPQKPRVTDINSGKLLLLTVMQRNPAKVKVLYHLTERKSLAQELQTLKQE